MTMAKLSLEHLSGARRGEVDVLASLPATIGSGPGVHVFVPGTAPLHAHVVREGQRVVLRDSGSGLDTLLAGAAVSTPTCGPCLGGHMGVLADGERAIATTNRNFRGRMGSSRSEVYLSSPAVVAASAVLGRIGGPGEMGL